MGYLRRISIMLLVAAFVTGLAVSCNAAPVKENSEEVKAPYATAKTPEAKKEPKKPAGYEGRLELFRPREVKLEVKAYKGKIHFEKVVPQRTSLKKGDEIATFRAPELDKEISEAREALELQEKSYALQKAGFKNFLKKQALELDRAEHGLKTAKQAIENWKNELKAERIRKSEMDVERLEHSVQDQQDELDQLEKMYKGNDLAKDSQEIVLNRARRRLKRTKESLFMRRNEHKRMLEYDIPNMDKEMLLRVRGAEAHFEDLQNKKKHDYPDARARLDGAEKRLEAARETLEKLLEDAECLRLVAPMDGVVLWGASAGNPGIYERFAVGDEVRPGTVVASVIDTRRLRLEIEVPVKKASDLEIGLKAKAHAAALGIDADAAVQAVGLIVKNGKVAVSLLVENMEGKLMPGMTVNVEFPEE